MRGLVIAMIVVACSIPLAVVTFNVGYNLADSKWEYKTQHLQETLDNCLVREKFGL